MSTLTDALASVNPDASYEQWINVGMALKHEGYSVDVWDQWSRRGAKYRRGECERKWASFNGSAMPVTGGTIYEYARQAGWQPAYRAEDGVMGWDDVIERDDDSTPARSEMTPVMQLITYLETLFEPGEYVGYVTDDAAPDEDGKWKPNGTGLYRWTAGDLITRLRRHPDDLGAAIGDWHPEAGAWIRFNPLDGNGVNDANVTRYAYTLVEADDLPAEEQLRLYQLHQLPIAALVSSAGRSVHAIVRVDAPDLNEYRKRVRMLYDYLSAHGLKVDSNNKNPARLSRMPGVTRNGKTQRLIGVNLGHKTWAEWVDWTEHRDEQLPDIEWAADVDAEDPPLAPVLIDGILRQGHKMVITSASKAGKTFLVLDLAIAITKGAAWLGHQCAQGNVLYVNLEIDRASLLNRLREIYKARGYEAHTMDGLAVWNLRGKAQSLDKLAPQLITLLRKRINAGTRFSAIILDPIYKIEMGDENSATDMAMFFNEFDRIAEATGAAVISVHHHSKGVQGGKKVADRGSGSGVFARDPDALLDITALELDDNTRNLYQDSGAQAFRMESVLREFAPIKPVDFWFDYPIYREDTTGALAKLGTEGSPRGNLALTGKSSTPVSRADQINAAYDAQAMTGEKVTVGDLAAYLDKSERSVRDWIKEAGCFEIKQGVVVRVKNE